MTLISLKFFVFLAIALICYYIIPLKYRWGVILVASAAFYLQGGIKAAIIVLCIAVFSYFMALQIEKCEKGRRQKLLIAIAIVVLLSVLAIIKVTGRYLTFIDHIIVPTGISYFSLSIVGYLLDVYWRKDAAEKNFAHYLTFILFFPKIIQGPISRHKFLAGQLIEGHKFCYKDVTFGAQLILWGVFKKIVLADRMNILVSGVYSDLENYTQGMVLILAMLLSALQLYFDFSGYTDIAIGVAQMFGIELEQNFNHPFFARSASEWWQRWHMSLSGWFKDYLFLPVSRSSFVKDLSKKLGKKYGATVRKKTMMVISSAVVWLATGLWHGTGINYLVWGAYWGGIIIASEILETQLLKLNGLLHINTEAPTWKLFQILRTSLIFIVGKMISAQNSLHAVKMIIYGIVKNTHFSDVTMLTSLGLSDIDFKIIVMGCIVVLIVSILQEKGIRIREGLLSWNAIPRWIFYSMAITVVLLLGLYGAGYDTSNFAYQFF